MNLLHVLTNQRLHRVHLTLRDFKDQLVVNLQRHS